MKNEEMLKYVLANATPKGWNAKHKRLPTSVRVAAWVLYFLVTANVCCVLAERLGIAPTLKCLHEETRQ